MGTHDEINNAEPQNEFISGFKIKREASLPPKEVQQPNVTQSQKIRAGLSSGNVTSGLQNRMGTNPYQLTQQMNKNTRTEQPAGDSFEQKNGTGFVQKIRNKFLKNEESETGNARQKIMFALIPVLFIVMIFMFRQVLWKEPKKTKAASGKEKKITAVAKASGGDINWKIPDPIPVNMRDPIKVQKEETGVIEQQNSSGNDSGNMDVKSILYSEDKPSAVIGDKLVYLNQTVNGITVIEIQRDYIVFEKDGSRWQQRVAEDQPRQNKKTNVPENGK
jgi:hypothetical protein